MSVRTHLKRIVSVVLISTLMSAPILASEVEKRSLTVEQAVKSAYSMDSQLGTSQLRLEYNKEQLKDADFSHFTGRDLDINTRQLEQSIAFSKDQISYNVWKLYNDYIVQYRSVELAKMNVEINKKELRQAEIQKAKGIMDQLSYDKAVFSLEEMKNRQVTSEERLSEMEKTFKQLTGFDISKYSLEEDIHYEPFKYGSNIEGYINGKIQEIQKFDRELADYTDETRLERASAGGYAPYYVDYLGVKVNISNLRSLIATNKESYRQKGMTLYSGLLSGEKQLMVEQERYILLERDLKIAEIKLKAGMISEYIFSVEQRKLKECEMNILTKTYECERQKRLLEKLWVN